MEVEQCKSIVWLFLKMTPSKTISMTRSRCELSALIYVFIGVSIKKNKQITLFLCFTFMPIKGVSFYSVTIDRPALKPNLSCHFFSINRRQHFLEETSHIYSKYSFNIVLAHVYELLQ